MFSKISFFTLNPNGWPWWGCPHSSLLTVGYVKTKENGDKGLQGRRETTEDAWHSPMTFGGTPSEEPKPQQAWKTF